jgi:phosphate transport system substrate-binding protein
MSDEFLHRLRKQPRPEFAARLQARLRRQAMSSLEPRPPSRARTLLTLLLLGGTAFALTSVAIRGLPPSLLVFYQHVIARIAADRDTSPAHGGTAEGLRWGASGYRPAPGAAANGGATRQLAAQTAGAQSAAATSHGPSSARAAPAGGIPSWRKVEQLNVVASWSAYPYVSVMAQSGSRFALRIEVSQRDSAAWPGPLCDVGSQAPDLAYAFERGSAVVTIPCPQDHSKNAVPVKAIPVGYESVVLARSPLYGALDLTRRQIFVALAKWLPDRGGTLHQNTHRTWRQIDPSLGSEPIEFIGPPLSSAEGHSMIELLMEAGCDTYPGIAALASTHPDRYAHICRTVRTDGVYSEVSGLAAVNLLSEPNAVGIFGFGYWTDPPLTGLAMSKLDGVEPTPQAIANGAYPGSRELYLYTRGRVPVFVLQMLLRREWAGSADWALVPPAPQDFDALLQSVQ